MAKQRDTYWKRCTSCNGLGYHEKQNKGGFYKQTCSTCQGAGGAYVPVGQ